MGFCDLHPENRAFLEESLLLGSIYPQGGSFCARFLVHTGAIVLIAPACTIIRTKEAHPVQPWWFAPVMYLCHHHVGHLSTSSSSDNRLFRTRTERIKGGHPPSRAA
jgi:hypothetical protein